MWAIHIYVHIYVTYFVCILLLNINALHDRFLSIGFICFARVYCKVIIPPTNRANEVFPDPICLTFDALLKVLYTYLHVEHPETAYLWLNL